jgi:two-component system phosphate regulon sensor histidine kinase PhoR
MNDVRYRWILYIIAVVVLSTITIQIYWNYKNYLVAKQQYINDVQISLDNAVDTYYANLAKENSIAYALDINSNKVLFKGDIKIDSILHSIDAISEKINISDSVQINIMEDVALFKTRLDSNNTERALRDTSTWHTKRVVVHAADHLPLDSLRQEDFKNLTSKVMISMTRDTLKMDKINNFLKEELKRKELEMAYHLTFDSPASTSKNIGSHALNKSALKTTSKSAYLPYGSTLTLHFNNATSIILKRILSGILISTFLVLALISCLFYLLYIIKQQKQIAEVKNDLISNITHEFKTPIATIGVALESIKHFNVIDDKEKTKSYLEMSENQLFKLNTMVEKLLETASLDSERLALNKEKVDLVVLLQILSDRHQLQSDSKTIHFHSEKSSIVASVDKFHMENALNNIIDNAFKYGGAAINISIQQNSFSVTITISDDGTSLKKGDKDQIFEKFYRVSKGNTHDIKGFGIGLYYTKKIIEKHNGQINLILENNRTSFKITVPNA